jgi:hypothetical protein
MLRKLFGFLKVMCRIEGGEMEVVRGVLELMGWRGNGGMGRKLLDICICGLGILRLTIVVEKGLGMLTVYQRHPKQAVPYGRLALDSQDEDTYQDPPGQETPFH